jgi:capsular exopolysaccharide synthesis family protein
MESKHYPAVPVNRARAAGEAPPGAGTAAASAPPTPAATHPASPPAILSNMPTYGHLLAAFRRRWRLAGGLGLLVGAIAAVVTYYLTSPLSYTATAIVWVNAGNNHVAFALPEGQKNMEVYQRSQIELAKSRLVLNAALREPEVQKLPVVREQSEPIDWLERQVQAEFTAPDCMQIRITGKDPQSVKVLVDAVRDAYIRESAPAEQKEKLARLSKLEKLFQEYTDNLNRQRQALQNLNDELLAGNMNGANRQQEFLLKERNAMEIKRIDLVPQLMTAKLEAEALREKVAKLDKEDEAIPQEMIDEALAKDPDILALQKEITALELLVTKYEDTGNNLGAVPAYNKAKTDLAAARTALEKLRAVKRPKAEATAREQRRRDWKNKLAEAETRFAQLEQLDALLKKRLEAKDNNLRKFGRNAQDLEILSDDIATLTDIVHKLGKDKEALKVEMNASPRVAPREDSYVVKRDSIALKYAAGAGAAGFLVVVLGISLLEFFARRVSTVGDVSGGLRLPVVGTLPLINARSSGAPGLGAAQQLLIESVDAARTVLLHAFRKKNLRTVMISSAGPGEGKTMLSAHLAASMARAGWRVLLIDGDMRCPSLHKVFGIPGDEGLGEALRGAANLREIVQAGPLPGLWLVPAGNGDAQTMRSLAQGGLALLLAEIKNEYDFILVDSAPILPVVDSQLMAQAVDGVILSVLQNVSRLPSVYAAYERMMLFQIDVLGVVVHGTAAGTYGNYYSYLPFPGKAAAEKKAE